MGIKNNSSFSLFLLTHIGSLLFPILVFLFPKQNKIKQNKASDLSGLGATVKRTQEEKVYKAALVGTGTGDDSVTRLGHDLSKGKEKG